jgi:hypothetical protein
MESLKKMKEIAYDIFRIQWNYEKWHRTKPRHKAVMS